MDLPRLSACIVTYRTDAALLRTSVASLARSVARAREAGLVADADLFIVDNSAEGERVDSAPALREWNGRSKVVAGHGNVGYGRANNLVLAELASDVHLVMNPDVEVDPGAVGAVLRAFREHPEVGLIAPAAFARDGARQYLCKRYPSLWVLFLRGFAPRFVRRRFHGAVDRYEMRDTIAERFVTGIPLASGSFMALRTALFREVGGFDPRYFMYFEDYDLSLRVGSRAGVAYVPEARIVHHGGEAASKGARHVMWFVRSAGRFFARHGWKLA